MNNDTKHTLGKSFFPKEPAENEEDSSWQVSYLDIITIVLAFLIIMLSITELGNGVMSSLSTLFGKNSDSTEYLTTPIEEIQEQLVILLKDQIDLGNLEIKKELNDLTIQFKGDDFYRSGSPILAPKGRVILEQVIVALDSLERDDFNIDVEGHTDNTPIRNSSFSSNWELSTTRASNVVKYFQSNDIDDERLKAAGFADSRPVIQFDSLGYPYAAPKAVNRRIVLRMYYTSDQLLASQTDTTNLQVAVSENAKEPVTEIRPSSPENISQPDEYITITPGQTPITGSELQCVYSVEAGNVSNLSGAFDIASSAESAYGVPFRLSEINDRIHVRTEPESSFISVLNNNDVLLNSSASSAFIHHCSDNIPVRPDYLEYKIQFGAFRNEQNAKNYAGNMSNSFSIPAYTEFTGTTYKVVTGPYSSRREVSQRFDEFRESGIEGNFYIKSTNKPGATVTSNYQVQIATGTNRFLLNDLKTGILAKTGISSEIYDLGDSGYYLLTSRTTDHQKAEEMIAALQVEFPENQLILHILELVP